MIYGIKISNIGYIVSAILEISILRIRCFGSNIIFAIYSVYSNI